MASVTYYGRALSAGDVTTNFGASQCLEMGKQPGDVCSTDYYYSAGQTAVGNAVDCLSGAAGVAEIQLDAGHSYPQPPLDGCPINPGTQSGATNHGGATDANNPGALLCLYISIPSLIPTYDPPCNNKTEYGTKTEENCPERRQPTQTHSSAFILRRCTFHAL